MQVVSGLSWAKGVMGDLLLLVLFLHPAWCSTRKQTRSPALGDLLLCARSESINNLM